MNFEEIKKTFEQRRYNLIRTLEAGREDIELSKQHQIYGAIKELENILKTITYYQNIRIEKDVNINLSSEPYEPIIKKISLKLKNFKRKEVLNE